MISDSDALRGAILACENAERLLLSSAHIKREGHVGPAAALCVLAFEEAVKAISLVYRSQGVQDNDWLSAYFKSHKAKHELGASTLKISVSQLAKVELTISFNEATFDVANLHNQIEEWRRRADTIKKRGFYVDFSAGEWVTPLEITDDVFNLGGVATSIAIGTAKVFIASAS